VSGSVAVAGLSARRGRKTVLDGVSIEVPRGEITALLGSNGAGKSSLVAVLGGLLAPSAGSVSLDGTPITGLSPERIRRAGLAVVPEGHRVLTDLTIADNLRVGLSHLRRREQGSRTDAVLERFPELGERLGQDAGSLSGGQQQMLAIAQALVAEPRYVVVDELSLGLAPIVVDRLRDVLVELAAGGVGVLLIEQFTMLALSISTRAYVLRNGRLVLEGAAEELREEPSTLADAYLETSHVDPARDILSPASGEGSGEAGAQ
jgi:branched-chain amino acid transport system ATP-binding protein